MPKQVLASFDPQGTVVPITALLPLKQVTSSIRCTHKYQQVLASVREVGIIRAVDRILAGR